MADYNEAYRQAYANLAAQFDAQKRQYDSARDTQMAALTEAMRYAQGKLENTRDSAFSAAYWNRLQAERDLPRELASAGIRGGMTETAYGDLLKTYENLRRQAQNGYSSGVADLSADYGKNAAGVNAGYTANLAAMENQRRQAAYDMAKLLYSQWQDEEKAAAAAAAEAAKGSSGGSRRGRSGGSSSKKTDAKTAQFTDTESEFRKRIREAYIARKKRAAAQAEKGIGAGGFGSYGGAFADKGGGSIGGSGW